MGSDPRSNPKGTSGPPLHGFVWVVLFGLVLYCITLKYTFCFSREASGFSPGFSHILTSNLKNYKVKKIPRFNGKALFVNVPKSYNCKSNVIGLSLLRKVMSIVEP